MTTIQPLTEHIADWRSEGLEIDRDRRLVRSVALTAIESKNGYRYSEHALQAAVPLYESRPVFLDHAVNVTRPYERSTRDLVGSITNPRYERGRVRGDIQALDTESGRIFLALAEADSPAVGMSHVVLAERSADGKTVERIHDVVSVDAVVFPATRSTFREQQLGILPLALPGSMEALLAEIERRLLRHLAETADIPADSIRRVGVFPSEIVVEVNDPSSESVRCYRLAWSIAGDGISLGDVVAETDCENLPATEWAALFASHHLAERLRAECDAVKERLRQFEQDQDATRREREIERLISESGLPDAAVTELFRRQLRSAADDETRKALLVERRLLVNRLRIHPPSSSERIEHDPALSDERFVAAVRRSAA